MGNIVLTIKVKVNALSKLLLIAVLKQHCSLNDSNFQLAVQSNKHMCPRYNACNYSILYVCIRWIEAASITIKYLNLLLQSKQITLQISTF